MELFAVAVASLLGYLFGGFMMSLRKKRNERKWNLMFEPYLTGETWFATGNNADMYDATSGVRYIEAEFARCMRGLGQQMPDENVTIRIPNVGSPRYAEAFFLRMRAPSDPQPPHYRYIGCHLFAASQGWTQAVR